MVYLKFLTVSGENRQYSGNSTAAFVAEFKSSPVMVQATAMKYLDAFFVVRALRVKRQKAKREGWSDQVEEANEALPDAEDNLDQMKENYDRALASGKDIVEEKEEKSSSDAQAESTLSDNPYGFSAADMQSNAAADDDDFM
jgi:hypothetical protein